ncbi:MAG: hypothetical protein EXS16_16045 [Gemmataceae bacterium]|nr:hypothetical protein [Gemmataceae bacterium]
MTRLFSDIRCLDFGPSLIFPPSFQTRLVQMDGAKPAHLRTQVRLLAPAQPGVYGMFDGEGELIYVGKAKNLRIRLQSYFRRKGRPPKAGRIVSQARRIVAEVLPSEFASLLRELELIRRWRPRWNVQGQPLRRLLTFVCISQPPAPYLFLSRQMTTRVKSAFGPIVANSNAVEAVRRFNDHFQLRDCPQPQEMIFPDDVELVSGIRPAGCLRMEIGTCLGPCTGTCERSTYDAKVRKARAFLTGADRSPLATLEAEMHAASQACAFEKAATLRDRWTALTWLAEKLDNVTQAQREMSFIYPCAGHDGSTAWYLIHGARVVGVIDPPNDGKARKNVKTKLAAIYRPNAELLDSYEHADGMLVVTQWFRKHPGERKRCLPPDRALV